MRVLSWNLRGCRSSEKRQYLKELLHREQVEILCLQESNRDSFSTRFLLSIAPHFHLWYDLRTIGFAGVC